MFWLFGNHVASAGCFTSTDEALQRGSLSLWQQSQGVKKSMWTWKCPDCASILQNRERKIKLVDEGGRSRQNAWGGNCAIESTLKKRGEHRESWVADCSKPARAFWWTHWGRLEASDKPTQLIFKPTQVMLAKSAAAWWRVPEHIKYASPRLLGLSHVSRLSFLLHPPRLKPQVLYFTKSKIPMSFFFFSFIFIIFLRHKLENCETARGRKKTQFSD